jgi:hypothetical protein
MKIGIRRQELLVVCQDQCDVSRKEQPVDCTSNGHTGTNALLVIEFECENATRLVDGRRTFPLTMKHCRFIVNRANYPIGFDAERRETIDLL